MRKREEHRIIHHKKLCRDREMCKKRIRDCKDFDASFFSSLKTMQRQRQCKKETRKQQRFEAKDLLSQMNNTKTEITVKGIVLSSKSEIKG